MRLRKSDGISVSWLVARAKVEAKFLPHMSSYCSVHERKGSRQNGEYVTRLEIPRDFGTNLKVNNEKDK